MLRSKLIPPQAIVFCIYMVMIITAINFQTTMWFSLFGFFPAPCFWAPIFTYLMMNRLFPKNLLWLIAFYLLFLTASSAVPLTLFLSLLTLWGVIAFSQKRVSTLGMFDFILFSAGSTVLFPLIYFVISLPSEDVASFDWVSLIISVVLSVPIIPPILVACRKLDGLIDPMNNPDNLVLDI